MKYASASLIALALLAAAAPARADNIDEELIQRARTVMKDLQDRQYKNVGVLKFRVKKGPHEPSFNVGLLNANMASRLETALVLVNNDKNPLGITRDASQFAAAQDPKLSYLNPKDWGKFFDQAFPLAWGKDKVKVDAFLTGQVKINPTTHKTTVIIESFDRKAEELREVVNFTVPTDRSILADTGESFSLVMRDLAKKRGEELEEEAVRDSEDRDKGKKVADNRDAIENLLDVEIYYDDKRSEVTEDKTVKGEKRVAEPREGQKVHFVLRNRTNERIGVVLRINGVNTLHKEGTDKQIDQYTKWILDPKKTYTLRGFYLEDGKTVETFKVLSPSTLGDLDPQKLGLIEVDVFRSAPDLDEGAARRKLSLRGLNGKERTAKDLAELKARIHKATSAADHKPLILPGEAEKTHVDEAELKSPVHTGSMTIRYYP